MKAFRLLKFWRNGDNDVSPAFDDVSNNNDERCLSSEFDEDSDGEDSFFELELTEPKVSCNVGIKFVESPNEMFRNGKVFPLDLNSSKPQSPISVLKPETKFCVFMLGQNKPKPEKIEVNGKLTATVKNGQSKRFAVKCTRDEQPAVRVLTRDNSLRSKLMRESLDESSMLNSSKRFDKDVLKYLKLMKPFYTKSSKKNGDQICSPLSSPASMCSPRKVSMSSPRKVSEEKRTIGFKNASKQLGRTRSELTPSPINRRDDSLLQQHDIQSAILHCKRSFNASPR